MLKRDKKVDPKKFSVFKRFIPKATKILAKKMAKNAGMYDYEPEDLSTDQWIKRIVQNIRASNMTMSDDDMIKDPGKAFTYYRENIESKGGIGELLERLEARLVHKSELDESSRTVKKFGYTVNETPGRPGFPIRWRIEFDNGYGVSIIPDPNKPKSAFRFEVAGLRDGKYVDNIPGVIRGVKGNMSDDDVKKFIGKIKSLENDSKLSMKDYMDKYPKGKR